MKYYLGVDLGGTNIAVGAVDETYNIVGRGKVKTRAPRPAGEVVTDIAEACACALADAGLSAQQVEWMGIGSPGLINSAAGEVEYAANLGFRNVPLRKMAFEATGIQAYLENDANAAAYGEVLAGGARGYRDVVALTLGTGVGGGIIIGGKIYAGFNHAGAELGHMGMVYGGPTCSCGQQGCVEMYCSTVALMRQTKEKMLACRDSAMWEVCDGDIEHVNGRTIFAAMRMGDEAAIQVFGQYCEYLGYAVSNYINMLQPQVLLISGGISKEGDTLLNPIREYMRKHSLVKSTGKMTRIEAATLENDAGIIGAAFLGML